MRINLPDIQILIRNRLWSFYFNEMICITGRGLKFEIEFKNNRFYFGTEIRKFPLPTKKLLTAYKNWQFDSEMKKILMEE